MLTIAVGNRHSSRPPWPYHLGLPAARYWSSPRRRTLPGARGGQGQMRAVRGTQFRTLHWGRLSSRSHGGTHPFWWSM